MCTYTVKLSVFFTLRKKYTFVHLWQKQGVKFTLVLSAAELRGHIFSVVVVCSFGTPYHVYFPVMVCDCISSTRCSVNSVYSVRRWTLSCLRDTCTLPMRLCESVHYSCGCVKVCVRESLFVCLNSRIVVNHYKTEALQPSHCGD